jgi:hypothetical protein
MDFDFDLDLPSWNTSFFSESLTSEYVESLSNEFLQRLESLDHFLSSTEKVMKFITSYDDLKCVLIFTDLVRTTQTLFTAKDLNSIKEIIDLFRAMRDFYNLEEKEGEKEKSTLDRLTSLLKGILVIILNHSSVYVLLILLYI